MYAICMPTHCNTLQRTATHYSTLQHTTTHYSIWYVCHMYAIYVCHDLSICVWRDSFVWVRDVAHSSVIPTNYRRTCEYLSSGSFFLIVLLWSHDSFVSMWRDSFICACDVTHLSAITTNNENNNHELREDNWVLILWLCFQQERRARGRKKSPRITRKIPSGSEDMGWLRLVAFSKL